MQLKNENELIFSQAPLANLENPVGQLVAAELTDGSGRSRRSKQKAFEAIAPKASIDSGRRNTMAGYRLSSSIGAEGGLIPAPAFAVGVGLLATDPAPLLEPEQPTLEQINSAKTTALESLRRMNTPSSKTNQVWIRNLDRCRGVRKQEMRSDKAIKAMPDLNAKLTLDRRLGRLVS